MTAPQHIIVAAGGTGGHVIPAHALAEALAARGHETSLITDARGLRFPGLFEGVPRHVIPAATLSVRQPGTWWHGIRTLLAGRQAARRLLENYRPAVVVGFGGYPSLPAIWAATLLKIPTLLHEQNAVLGRTNHWLSRRANVLATTYEDTARLPKHKKLRLITTGNPVRARLIALRDEPYPTFEDDSIFRVLVIGGSQGAQILSEVVPAALAMLPIHLRRRLQVTQQCRPEDIDSARALYAKESIAADLATYIEDMETHLRFAHLVIARAGATTVAELSVVGRPAIFVPLPGATDNHQVHNTRDMVAAGGARMILQSQFTPVELARQIQKMALTPHALANAAARTRSVGRPEAANHLADLIEEMASQHS